MEFQIGRTSNGETSSQKDEGSRVARVCSAGQCCAVLVQPAEDRSLYYASVVTIGSSSSLEAVDPCRGLRSWDAGREGLLVSRSEKESTGSATVEAIVAV